MEPHYWSGTGLTYPGATSQPAQSRQDIIHQAIASGLDPTNMMSGLELLLLDRNRLTSGLPGFLTQPPSLPGHPAMSYASALPSASFSSSLLDAQSMYTYPASLSQPYPIVSSRSQTYTATSAIPASVSRSSITNDPDLLQLASSWAQVVPANLNQHMASANSAATILKPPLLTSNVQKRTSDYSAASKQQQSAGLTAMKSQQSTITMPGIPLLRSDPVGSGANQSSVKLNFIQQQQQQQQLDKGKSSHPCNQPSADTNQRLSDLDSRYYSLSNFIDSTIASQNQTMPITTRDQLIASSKGASYIQPSVRHSTQMASSAPTYMKSTVTQSQKTDCQQQQLTGNAVDLSQYSKVLDAAMNHGKPLFGTDRSMLTIDANELLEQLAVHSAYGGNADHLQMFSQVAAEMLSNSNNGNNWLLAGQQYDEELQSGVNETGQILAQYEAVSPSPADEPLTFDSTYPSAISAVDQYASSEYQNIPYQYVSNVSRTAEATDSSKVLPGSTGGSVRKKPGESGIGIVLPMLQTREPDQPSVDSYNNTLCSGVQAQSNVAYPASSVATVSSEKNKIQDVMATFTPRSKDVADSSQPIYLANINGNVYVNQYTMFQPPGDTVSADDYHVLSDFGIGQSDPVFQTIDPAGFQSILDGTTTYPKGIAEEIPANSSTKEPEVSSRVTMLVPNEDDQELGHLKSNPLNPNQTANCHSQPLLSPSAMPAQAVKPLQTKPPVAGGVDVSALKTKPANKFESSFLKFLSGEKTETLSSVSSTSFKSKPVLPKYIPEVRRPAPVASVTAPVTCSNDSIIKKSDDSLSLEKVQTDADKTENNLSQKVQTDADKAKNNISSVTTDSTNANGVTAAPKVGNNTPIKFPAKFSHKMHNRTHTVVVENNNTARLQSSMSTTTASKPDLKRQHSSEQTPTTSKRKSTEGNESNSEEVQWVIATTDKYKSDAKNSANHIPHIPVLVIKAVPPSRDQK